jgi:hypothetical protein
MMTGAINPKVRLVMRLIIGVFLVVIVNFQIATAAEISRVYSFMDLWGSQKIVDKIEINGKIESGDFKKFMTLLKKYSRQKDLFEGEIDDVEFEKIKNGNYGDEIDLFRLGVVLNSRGGDVIEAIKIGRAIKKFRLTTSLTSTGDPNEKCMSACFFIYVSGVVRSTIISNNKLGIHRPYFDPDYFAGLSSTDAEKTHKSMTENTKQYLRDMNISEELIELTYRISPEDLYFIHWEDAEKWIGEFQPFFKDWVFAKCDHIEKLTAEEEDDFKNMLKRNFSLVYRTYLLTKRSKTNDCINASIQTEQFRLLNAN